MPSCRSYGLMFLLILALFTPYASGSRRKSDPNLDAIRIRIRNIDKYIDNFWNTSNATYCILQVMGTDVRGSIQVEALCLNYEL
jgi:hypothetical protein